MSLKDLFGQTVTKGGKKNVVSLAKFSQYLDDVESVGYVEEYIKDKNRFKSHTDWSSGSNFCSFGSLTEYYEAGINRIQEQYPYDGSLKEKLEYFNNSSGFDLHLFEKEYPRSTGYVTISANRAGGNGWGTVASTSGSYGNPTTKEYIYIKAGPNKGNFHSTASLRASNLGLTGKNGNTVEFWLKKSEYVSSKTAREVIFDAWTKGNTEESHKYGRMTVELDSSNSNKSPFYLTYQSGTYGFKNANVGETSLFASVRDDSWHHYAFTFKNVSGSVQVRTYVDGTLTNTVTTGSAIGELDTPIVGAIGALVSGKNTLGIIDFDPHQTTAGLGYGKLSGSLDEFRFWKKERSPQDVGRFWNTQVGAGANTDTANSPLGVYYKFNEGITTTSSIDNSVLDYSGRISNGEWVGYASVGRHSGSAMTEASASIREFADPIIYKDHPLVKSFTAEKLEQGYAYDLDNNSSLYYTMPDWIVDEDQENGNELRKITQIVASYFDSLYQQIKDMNTIAKKKYHDFDFKPHPFNSTKLESLGLITPELFLDTSTLNMFLDRSEDDQFKEKVHDIKNYIYNNIYNNLDSIYKSKGTEKSFRNLFRCFGIDNELIKINLYSTDSEYPIESSYSPSTVKTKYVNFNSDEHTDSSVIQSIDGLTGDYRLVDARGYITGSNDTLASSFADFGSTTELQVFFPPRYDLQHPFYFSTPLSSSIMGCHAVRKKTGSPGATDSTTSTIYGLDGSLMKWTSVADDTANFQLYAVKDKLNSKTAKFVLKCRNNLFDPIETPYIIDLYDSNRWNLAVRVKPSMPFAANVSGSTNSHSIELIAQHAIGDTIQTEYHISSSLAGTIGNPSPGVAATATVTISDVDEINAGDTVQVITTGGTVITATAHASTTTNTHTDSPTFAIGTSSATALALATCLNAHDEISAARTAATVVTITQLVTGQAGNTAITLTDSGDPGLQKTDFTNGANSASQNWANTSKRFYLGAHRTDFEGGLLQGTDVKVSNFRHWLADLSLDELRSHAYDPRSYGLENPSRLSFPLTNIGNVQIPKIDLLAVNWDFSNLTGSNANGEMWINDISSGSLDDIHGAGAGRIAPITRRLHPAKGINFYTATTSSVDVEFDSATRLQPFENVRASDMVQILSNDDLTFTRETKPTDYYFSFEKSMYAAITDEMLNFFAGVNEFNNLIGAPVERYRQDYKGMSKLRQIFFDRIQNEPDIERYMEYYKWLDSSLSIMIDQLIPASVASSGDIQNVIESHILERNKYQSKYPTVEFKQTEPIGNIRGINELLYDWEHGHAPISAGGPHPLTFTGSVNCLWQKERAQRNTDILSDDPGANSDREIIRRVGNTSVSGSTYATRRLSKPYKLTVEPQRHTRGGSSFFGNSKRRFFAGVTRPSANNYIVITGSEINITDCADVQIPNEKKKWRAPADITATSKDHDSDLISPFSLYSSSLDQATDYHAEVFKNTKQGLEISNIHTDAYGDDRELTLQSPFTEKWVGGSQFRHVDLNRMLRRDADENAIYDSETTRFEGFRLLAAGQKLYTLPPNASGLTDGNVPIIDQSYATAQYLREPLAKRPVNVRNIQSTTASFALGNFNHSYDIVQYTSADQRKDFLVDNIQPLTSSMAVRRSPDKVTATLRSEVHAATPGASDHFGSGVAISGDYAVVGAYKEDQDASEGSTLSNPGSAYVFKKQANGTWSQVQKIVASDRADDDYFGFSVDIDGDTIVVGAYAENSQAGSAYVFTRSGETWSQQAKLVASDAAANDRFGYSVAIDGDTVVAGAYQEDENAAGGVTLSSAGSAYVFVRSGSSWSQQEKLVASDRDTSDFFGRHVSISGDTVIAGAYGDDTNASDSSTLSSAGAAFVFIRSGSSWSQQQKLVASDRGTNEFFGWQSSIDGDIAAISSYGYNGGTLQGSVYVFTRSGSTWTETKQIIASDGAAGDYFAHVALSRGVLAVAAYQDDSDEGSVYLYGVRNGDTWSSAHAVKIPNPSDSASGTDNFGYSLDLDGNQLVIGAYLDDDNSASGSGTAYFYELDGSVSLFGAQEFSKIVRPIHKNVFTARFSAPGGTEVAGDARGGQSLDRETNQYSVYNSLNYRNLSVRGPRNYLDSIAQTASVDSTNLETDHKVNLNAHFRRKLEQDGGANLFNENKDNAFVSHPIPRNDYQYSWITASLRDGLAVKEIPGHLHSFTQASLGSATGSMRYERTYEFMTSSVFAEGVKIPISTDVGQYIQGQYVVDADRFAYSLSADEDYFIAGTRDDHVSSVVDVGSAYIYKHVDGGWQEQQFLTSSLSGDTTKSNDEFGYSVGMSYYGGNYRAIVGRRYSDDEQANSGEAEVYEKQAGEYWKPVSLLTASLKYSNNYFGSAVDISGDWAVVGALGFDVGGTDRGAAFIFKRREDGTWQESQLIQSSDGGASDNFGEAVAIYGNTIAVTAHGHPSTDDYGALYIFEYDGTTWSQVANLEADVKATDDEMGKGQSTLGIYGNEIIVGAYSASGDNGKAFIFKKTGGTWAQSATLVPTDLEADDSFGFSVDIYENMAVVSSLYDDTGGVSNHGSIYVFQNTNGTWAQVAKLYGDATRTASEFFGTDVALTNKSILGASYASDGANADYEGFIAAWDYKTPRKVREIDYAGLNTYVLDNINTNTNTLTSVNSQNLTGTIAHRQGPYGWPSWKQIRSGDSALGRYIKRNNIYAPIVVKVSEEGVNKFVSADSSYGNYSWPNNIEHTKGTNERKVDVQQYRFTDPPVTINKYPIEVIKPSARSGRLVRTSFTYGNNLVNFANPDLSKVLNAEPTKNQQKEELLSKDGFKTTNLGTSNSNTVMRIRGGIFPKEENTFLEKSRTRSNFKADDFWKTARLERTRTNVTNSQGQTISKLSVWPLDPAENFRTVALKKTTDRLIGSSDGTEQGAGTGELFAEYSIFHNNMTIPSASALFARPFPVQATSSLPNTGKYYVSELSASYSNNMQPEGYFNPYIVTTTEGFANCAQATLTVSDNADFTNAEYFILTISSDAVTNTSPAITFQVAASTANQTFAVGADATATATNIATTINDTSQTSDYFSATSDGNVVTIFQKIPGAAGNTAITENIGGLTKTDFTGGSDKVTAGDVTHPVPGFYPANSDTYSHGWMWRPPSGFACSSEVDGSNKVLEEIVGDPDLTGSKASHAYRTTHYDPINGRSYRADGSYYGASSTRRSVLTSYDWYYGQAIPVLQIDPMPTKSNPILKAYAPNVKRLDRAANLTSTGLPAADNDAAYAYAWARTTSSYEFPGVIKYHAAPGHMFGSYVHQSPLYVQVGKNDGAWQTVGIISGSTHMSSSHKPDEGFFYPNLVPYEHAITASVSGDVRFITYAPNTNTVNRWYISMVNIHTLKEVERKLVISDNNGGLTKHIKYAAISEMANSSSFNSSYALGDVNTSGEGIKAPRKNNTSKTEIQYVSPQTEDDFSLVDFSHINKYADIRYTNRKTPGQLITYAHTSGNFDYRLKVTSSLSPLRIYAKNEKLDHHLYGSQFYKVPEDEARNPFNYDNYEDFSYQSRLMAKGYSVLPEFRISEHMDYYINTVGGEDPFFECNKSLFTITGSSTTSDSSEDTFYKTYTHSEFIKQFDVIQESIEDVFPSDDVGRVLPTRLTITCKAFKKFLPYKGFYPADRMTQMASLFSSSYNQHVSGGHWRNVLAPYYAPGIAFNTVKSGIAVDYPIFEPHPDRIYNQYGVMFQSASLVVDEPAHRPIFRSTNGGSSFTTGHTLEKLNIGSTAVNPNTGYPRKNLGLAVIDMGVSSTADYQSGCTYLIESLDGTQVTYTSNSTTNVASNQFYRQNVGSSVSNYNARTELAKCILSTHGHGGKVGVSILHYGQANNAGNFPREYPDGEFYGLLLTGVKNITYTPNLTSLGAAYKWNSGMLSKNRIEIGDGSSWAQALTGSGASHNGKLAVSFWMYLPSTNEIDSNINANNKIFENKYGQSRLLGQRGVILSLGSGNDTTLHSWKKGLHLTYQVSPFMDNTSQKEYITNQIPVVRGQSYDSDYSQYAAGFDYSPGDKSHTQIYFQLFGGNGKDKYFCWQSGPGTSQNGSDYPPLVAAAWAVPGWNHFYIETSVQNLHSGLSDFKVYRNGHQYTTSEGVANPGTLDNNDNSYGYLGRDAVNYVIAGASDEGTRVAWVTAPGDGTGASSAAPEIELDGHRNCYIGNHLGNTIRINRNIVSGSVGRGTAVAKILDHSSISAGQTLTFNTTDGTTITATAHASTTTSTDTNSPTFDVGDGSNSATATNLATCLNANSKITAKVGSGPGSNANTTVIIKQIIPGSAGNTTVTWSGTSTHVKVCDFYGGDAGLAQYQYSEQLQGVLEHGVAKSCDRSNATSANHAASSTYNAYGCRTPNFCLDFLKPSECMMSEFVILNTGLTDAEIKKLAGTVANPQFQNNFSSSFGQSTTALPDVSSMGKGLGPTNPYSVINSNKHDNIIAWYRPGNDTGYNKKTTSEAQDAAGGRHATTNRLPVFNHAQPMHSGKIISGGSGSFEPSDKFNSPKVKNFLSGTFYGFTDWTGSVANDLSVSDKYRQRWNGIVDISNPYQYTHIYDSSEDIGVARTGASPAFKYKTWRFSTDSRFWTKDNFGIEKNVLIDSPIFESYVTKVTGAIKLPTYIQGTKLNFTDDVSIPRIGSASLGTYHYTGSGNPVDDPVTSYGWSGAPESGVRSVTRIPFEAIIEPERFTPSMVNEDDPAKALFYDMEPHPSSSLNGTFFQKRRFAGIHDADKKNRFVCQDDLDHVDYKSNEKYAIGIPIDSGSNMSTFDLDSARATRSLYALAANNFYAECLNFFIADQKGVTIRSSDELKEAVKQEKTYSMKIELKSGVSSRKKDNPMYNNPAAFGPPVDAGKVRPQTRGIYLSRSLDLHGYGFSPYTPSHYDGDAHVTYTFKPDDSVVYDSVESVLRDTTIVYSRKVSATGSINKLASGRVSNESDRSIVPASYNRRFAMHLSESFYGTDAASETAFVQSYDNTDQPIPGKRSLVIQTKFECPTFDFSGVVADQPRTDKSVQHLPNIKGIWHQSGDFKASNRPTVVIKPGTTSTNKGDLSSLLGIRFDNTTSRKKVIGEMPSRLKVSEAVVAIPFITKNGKKEFFKLPEQEVYQAVRNLGFKDYKLLSEADIVEQRNRANQQDATSPDQGRRTLNDDDTKIEVRPSITSMVSLMLNYNIPPQFNFLKYNDKSGKYITPFAMYLFPFSTTLDRTDIARIWQNTTPNCGLDFGFDNQSGDNVISRQTVSHELFGLNDLLNPEAEIEITRRLTAGAAADFGVSHKVINWAGGINSQVQWMVFKIKQKAETSFFKKKELDRLPLGHPERVISVEDDKFRYGYNWPYDYFSLVELVNLDAAIDYSFKERELSEEEARILSLRKREEEF